MAGMDLSPIRYAAVPALGLWLAACSAVPPASPAAPRVDPQQRLAGDTAAAAAALDQALELVPDDPALLQERAEVALLQERYDQAETLARRAFDLGSKVGPLCRRHWATIEQAREARNEPENVASARAQREACTVPGVIRY